MTTPVNLLFWNSLLETIEGIITSTLESSSYGISLENQIFAVILPLILPLPLNR